MNGKLWSNDIINSLICIYSYRLVKKCFLKICEISKCHNFLIFQLKLLTLIMPSLLLMGDTVTCVESARLPTKRLSNETTGLDSMVLPLPAGWISMWLTVAVETGGESDLSLDESLAPHSSSTVVSPDTQRKSKNVNIIFVINSRLYKVSNSQQNY